MKQLLRHTLLAATLLLLGVSTAPAQTYDIIAEQSDLAPDGGSANARCIVEASDGTLVFFNDGGIYAWDGTNLIEHTSPSTLNSNISGESNSINRCDAVTIDGNDFVYFSFRNSDSGVNYVYRTDVGDASTFSVKEVDGTNGLTVDGSTLYLAGVADFGFTRNGVFEISSDLSGDTTAVATNPNINLGNATIDTDASGTVYGFDTGFDSGSAFQDTVIVSVDPSASSPSFNNFADPYAGGTLTESDDLIVDLEVVEHKGAEYITVYNASFGASSGEEWGTIRLSDQSVSLLFTQDDLANNTSASGYTGGFTEPMAVNSSGDVFVVSRDAFGASDYIARVSGAPPLPVEMAGFDAVKNGSSVELTWQTASETNNAGFNVQHQTESGWRTLGFVKSKVHGGTTTEALSYRYTVKQELDAGTHRFRLQQKDLDGSTSLSDVETIDVALGATLTLQAPMPNPTRGQATVKFGLKEATETSVTVYNVLGQRVKTLYQGTPQTGEMTDVTFNAGTLPSGVYFVRLRADGQTRTERLTVVQ